MALREDVLANTLHILSATTSNPLVLRDDGSLCVLSGADSDDKCHDSDISSSRVHISVLLGQMVAQLYENDDHLTIARATNFMIDIPNSLDDDRDKYNDKILWTAGLKLITDIICEDKINGVCDESIQPHLMLTILMDSFCYGDDKPLDDIQTFEQQHLSSSLAIFYLRILVSVFAIEKSVNLTRQSIEFSSIIRWRRLRSMLDDVISMFKKAVLNLIRSVRDPNSQTLSDGLIKMATHIYIHNMFPACRDLLQLLLKNTSDAAFFSFTIRTYYDTFDVMTILAALGFIFGEREEASSGVLNMIVRVLGESHTDHMFRLMMEKSSMFSNKYEIQSLERFYLRDEVSAKSCEKSSNFIDHLLLYPSLRVVHEVHMTHSQNNDEVHFDPLDENLEEKKVYDSLGIAAIAYCILQTPSSPCPYSREYFWKLFFPHVHILLRGLNNTSATFDFIHHHELNETKIIEKGLNMFETMITLAPDFIETYQDASNSRYTKSDFTCCIFTLKATLEALLSTALRLSMFEAVINNSPNASPLKFTSHQVMFTTQTLLGLYKPIMQIRVLGLLSHKMKYTYHMKVLLPRVIDWMRSVAIKICTSMKQKQMHANYQDDKVTNVGNVDVIIAITETITPFFQDFEFTFDNTKPPLPRDVPDFMSMVETYTSLLSTFRAIKIWINCVQSITAEDTVFNDEDASFHQIVNWVQNKEILLRGFSVLLADLLDFWSRTCSTRDTKLCVRDDIEAPPLGWHRFFLLLYTLQEVLN